MASSQTYVPVKTIHNQANYVVMDGHDQEAKKFRRSVNLTKGYQ